MMKNSSRVGKMTLCALLAAMYVVLSSYLSIRITFLHITFASLPVVLAAFLLGTGSAVLVAGMGEFIAQLLLYGMGVSTVLFTLPPMVRGLVVGLLASALCRGIEIEKKPLRMAGILMAGSISTSVTTTAVLWIDSHLMGYYSFAVVFGAAIQRMVTSLVTACLITLICIPVLAALRRAPAIRHR